MTTLSRVVFWLSILVPTLPLSLTAQATSGRIVGRVVDTEQGRPISGATVEVIGTALSTLTALDGRYAFQDVPPGLRRPRVDLDL